MSSTQFCGPTGGILANCETRKKAIGGVKTKFWLGSVDELDTTQTLLNVDGSLNITALDFDNYCGLYAFTTIKGGANGTDDISQDEDGNAFFPHTMVQKLYDVSATQIELLEDWAYVDSFGIYEDFNGEFQIFGLPYGVTISSAPKSTGNIAGDSTARVVTWEGNQNILRRKFSAGTYAQTKATLVAYEVG